jgi:hypothetical protein
MKGKTVKVELTFSELSVAHDSNAQAGLLRRGDL